MTFPQVHHHPLAHSSRRKTHTSGWMTNLSGSSRCGTVGMASTSSRLDPLSPRFGHLISLPCPMPGSGPSPQPLIVFPFFVAIQFASSTFKTRNSCWMKRTSIPIPIASLRMEVSSQLLSGAVYISGSMLPVVTPGGENSGVITLTILSSRPLRRQSWVVPWILSRCCVYMNPPLPPRPIMSNS